ncbi:MAG: acetyl-CoA carboxylase biotin carboxylase subunit [Coriobacteriales bacterium]|jgi:acetyl-CoA carboxylase biotin carboxylase subunit|nr:acetyl-CoA carboxylase biotin carboxylase subunit [Coriobacteriales bacterium]
MLKRILVANRGEIAARILRACREMNIETVAIFSEADRGSLFTTLATRAVCVGGARSSESYLNQDAVITAALGTGCDGLHPGFGFLSENAGFAARVRDAGLTFIGPKPEVIALLGNKDAARALMRKAGVPVVPGSDGLVASAEQAARWAERIGYPVLVKAANGGGGRGMRRVDGAEDLARAFDEASAEALACFGDGSVYLERLIESPRHIEFQILADTHGTCLHLGERDCSVQRNHQKLLEEAPAAALSSELRGRMAQAALNAARSAGYTNAGTVEFIVDAGRAGAGAAGAAAAAGAADRKPAATDDGFYFIEMNTRIQVEHPVTEMVTGVNIVREQIRIASGLPLQLAQEDVHIQGHAIECRINAEDPEEDFRPCPGTIGHLHLPNGFGVRVDTVIHPGYEVGPFYDSMIAKVIVHGRTRNEAILRMRRALEETLVTGIPTTIGMHYLLMYDPDFLNNHIDTGFIERKLSALLGGVRGLTPDQGALP